MARGSPNLASRPGLFGPTAWTRCGGAPSDRCQWRTISLRLSDAADAPSVFAIDAGTGGQPQRRSTLTLDGATGTVIRFEPFESQSVGRRLRSWTRFTHTGEYYGIAGQTIAGVASAGASILVVTGLALAVRRVAAATARSRVRARLPRFAVAATRGRPTYVAQHAAGDRDLIAVNDARAIDA